MHEQFGLTPNAATSASPGETFGRCRVLAVGRRPNSRRAYAVVQCSCGSPPHVARVDGLKSGSFTSCGCANREIITRHGLHSHPLYNRWKNMLARCYDPKAERYPHYGGRGITVCDQWHEVAAFVADMAPTFIPGLEIDRIDNDGHYEPANCQWATHTEQARKKRNLRMVTFGDRTLSLAEWAREYGVKYGTVRSRLSRGWTAVEAITTLEDGRRS